jgi:hypothetical protein
MNFIERERERERARKSEGEIEGRGQCVCVYGTDKSWELEWKMKLLGMISWAGQFADIEHSFESTTLDHNTLHTLSHA